MKKEKPKIPKSLLARFTDLFKSKCPKCGEILEKSRISARNKKGKIVPMLICPKCGYNSSKDEE